MVPGERLGAVALVALGDVDDVAEGVVDPGIGGVGLFAPGVVGAGDVDVAARKHGDPLGAVHRRGPHVVGGQAGLHQHLRVAVEPVLGGEAVPPPLQTDPTAGAVVVELGDVEPPALERALAGGDGVAPRMRADELVDVVEALVVAHVDHGVALGVLGDHGGLVLEAPEAGVLHRRGGRVVGVDLDDPAERVGTVRVEVGPPRVVGGRPLVAEALTAHAVTLVAGGLVVADPLRAAVGLLPEVAVEVLLAGEEGAPRGGAVAAVVDGADRVHARRIVVGDEEIVAAGPAGETHRRVGGDAAGVAGVDHVPAVVALLHRHDGDTVGGLLLAGLLRRPVLATVGKEEMAVGVLLVDAEDAERRRAVDREELHPVVAHAHLLFLLVRRVRGVAPEGGAAGHDRVAPRHDGLGRVAGRHRHGVGGVGRDRLERQQGVGARRPRHVGRGVGTLRRGEGRSSDERCCADHAALEQPAPRQAGVGHLGEGPVARTVGDLVVSVVDHERHLTKPGWRSGCRSDDPSMALR